MTREPPLDGAGPGREARDGAQAAGTGVRASPGETRSVGCAAARGGRTGAGEADFAPVAVCGPGRRSGRERRKG